MIRSIEDIEHEMYVTIEDLISDKVKGGFYPSDCRPFDSAEEDAVLTVSNASARQIQEGRARLNIFVNDIDNGYGRKVPNKERLRVLSRLDGEIIGLLNKKMPGYLFSLFKATETIAVPNLPQHFVNINIEFKVTTF